MNIGSILPYNNEINVKSTAKSVNSVQNTNGANFAESIAGVAKAAKMQIAKESNAASLAFTRNKEELHSDPFSFLEAEEEIIEESIGKIKQLFDNLNK
ncbi:MAG: hypothetical protein U9R38_02405 [Candidatus Margulisiibacteriota bacterium]|nr:hypothetical protein [Candidatus Margulisiibacteriota bacterium]